MIALSWIIGIFSGIFLVISAIAFLKAKDVFVMAHIVKISNFYITPLILIAITLEKFSLISMVKIMAILILNIAIANLLCYLILKNAIANKIEPDADTKHR